METGTLKELDVKPGDVVECIRTSTGQFNGVVMKIDSRGWACPPDGGFLCPDSDKYFNRSFRIISRATSTPDLTAITTPFGLLDEATKEALRAHGGPYEIFTDGSAWVRLDPEWFNSMTYRVKPTAKRETVTREFWLNSTDGRVWNTDSMDDTTPIRVTFDRIDGKIDLSTYKVEPR